MRRQTIGTIDHMEQAGFAQPAEDGQFGLPIVLVLSMVPEEGVEPTHSCEYGILSPARLPVPPLRLELFRISLRTVNGTEPDL